MTCILTFFAVGVSSGRVLYTVLVVYIFLIHETYY
jgi:hypothetical protein